jgi:hypothetical protein
MSNSSEADQDFAERTTGRLLVPGQTCWRVARAKRFTHVVDGVDYLRHAKLAKHRIMLVGWDLDYQTAFERGGKTLAGPNQLGPFLHWLVWHRRGLQVPAEVEPAPAAGSGRLLVRRHSGPAAQPGHHETDALRRRRRAPDRRGAPPEDRRGRRQRGVLRGHRPDRRSLGPPRAHSRRPRQAGGGAALRPAARGRRRGG